MRFLDLCEKEVVSVEEGRFIGHGPDIILVNICESDMRRKLL